MAALVDLDLNPDRRTLRQFGFVAMVGFGLLAYLAWSESLVFAFGLGASRLPLAYGFGALAVLCPALSLVAPAANRPIYVGLSLLTFPIGFVLSHVILALLFFGMFAPLAIALRIAGRDPMRRRTGAEDESYWDDARRERTPESYFRQF